MLDRKLRRGSMVAGAIVLIVSLGAGPVAALTVTKTAVPDKIEGKSGTITYTVTVSNCEDTTLGCFIFGVDDDTTVCTPAGTSGCVDGPVTECGPALIGGLSGPDTYECTYTRKYSSDTPAVITDTATVEGFIGLSLVPFSISDSETVSLKAKPSSGTNTGTSGGTTGSVVTGQNVNVHPPRVSVPDARSLSRRTVARSADADQIEKEVENSSPDADKIEAEVRNSLR